MTLTIMGIKKGMTRLFDDKGNTVVCTVIHVEPNVVTQVKNVESDGYSAVQLAAVGSRNESKAMKGHFAKANVAPRRHVLESRVEKVDGYAVGSELGVELFSDISFVDVSGVSKGKGYQGVMKRHNFAGGPASHGSGFHRHGGSCGMRTSPGRCLPGQKKAGRMGFEMVSVQSLRVLKADPATQTLVVQGHIPGPRGGLVKIQKAKKR